MPCTSSLALFFCLSTLRQKGDNIWIELFVGAKTSEKVVSEIIFHILNIPRWWHNGEVGCYAYFSPAQCPANEERSASSGMILSPGFPQNYPNSQTCSWIIKVQPPYTISIYVEMFQSEKQFDELEIFDGKNFIYFFACHSCCLFMLLFIYNVYLWDYAWRSYFLPYIHTYICSWRQHFKMYILTPGPSGQSPLLVALSGNHSTQLNFTSKTSQLYLRWSTDHATNKKGFKIRYTGNFRAFRKLPFLFCFYIMTTCCYIASHNTVLSFRQEPVVRSNLDSETCDVNVSPHAGFSSSAGLV